jgi:UDP-N-acetylmuramoyl-tripeptide--D-alanyl-D-alanine ligase
LTLPSMVFSSLKTIARVIHSSLDQVPDPLWEHCVTDITTDSRAITDGCLFVALVGERFDGHDFVSEALAQGARAAIVQRHHPALGDAGLSILPVPDTLAAYQSLGQWWRTQQSAAIVAITGSVGKTTTKELIAAALATEGQVLKTEANYNNEIGVPKTLLHLRPDHRFGVIEMGMRGPGEIALLTQIATPDVAVITNVGTAHIGRLGSEQAIANAKCELLAELSPTGVAVLNHDNPRLMATASQVWEGRTLTFGLAGGDIHGQLQNDGTMLVDGVVLPLPLPGRHNAQNLLAAVAVMQALGLDWRRLRQGLTVNLPTGRSRWLMVAEDITLLDETYNAGVESMTAALELLAETPGKRHIAVLGTMKELGDRSIALHRRVGQVVAQLKLDALFALTDPDEAVALAEGATGIPTEVFADANALVQRLAAYLQPADRVLFKASRSVALDQVVNQLVAILTDVATR